MFVYIENGISLVYLGLQAEIPDMAALMWSREHSAACRLLPPAAAAFCALPPPVTHSAVTATAAAQACIITRAIVDPGTGEQTQNKIPRRIFSFIAVVRKALEIDVCG